MAFFRCGTAKPYQHDQPINNVPTKTFAFTYNAVAELLTAVGYAPNCPHNHTLPKFLASNPAALVRAANSALWQLEKLDEQFEFDCQPIGQQFGKHVQPCSAAFFLICDNADPERHDPARFAITIFYDQSDSAKPAEVIINPPLLRHICRYIFDLHIGKTNSNMCDFCNGNNVATMRRHHDQAKFSCSECNAYPCAGCDGKWTPTTPDNRCSECLTVREHIATPATGFQKMMQWFGVRAN
jgi:hypothetical protein